MGSIKNKFLEGLKFNLLKGAEIYYNNFGFDQEAIDQANELLESEGFAEEVFANTYAVLFKEDDLEKIMQLTVELEDNIQKGLSENGLDFESFSSKINDVKSRFFQDFDEEFGDIWMESIKRQQGN